MADDKAPKTIDIPIPQKLQKMIGLPYSSHTMWSGIDPAEYNRDFANFRTAIATYEKMVRSDSQCQSVWNVIKLWLDSLTYRVDPPKEPTPEETRLRDLCERGLYQQPNASGDLPHPTQPLLAKSHPHEAGSPLTSPSPLVWVHHKKSPRLHLT